MRVLTILASLFLLCEGQYVEISCEFTLSPIGIYICDASEYFVSHNVSQQTIVIVGNHVENKTNLDVYMVTIHNQPVSTIITEIFTSFPNLVIMYIRGGVTRIQEDAFRFAEHLTVLEFFNSPLRILPANSMAGAVSLRSLGFSYCDLERIDQNAFVGVNQLDFFQVYGSNLRSIPENVFTNLNNLSSLGFFYSPLRRVPAGLLDNNLQLKNIILYGNEVNEVPKSFVDNFANMVYLEEFTFVGNSCGNNSRWHPSLIEQIHLALEQRYSNYDERRQYSFDLKGSLVIRDGNGDIILEL